MQALASRSQPDSLARRRAPSYALAGQRMESGTTTDRDRLPQLDGGLFLTDGGIETVLIFQEGIDLPLFASFDLLKDDGGTETIRNYYEPYLEIARESGSGFILESPTWRASPDWAAELGHSDEDLAGFNRKAIELMREIRDANESVIAPIVVSGCVGPRGDGYQPGELMSADEAHRYHSAQIGVFAEAGADMVTAITMTYPEEAIGIVRAAATSATGRDLVHGRDRRAPADRSGTRRGDRAGRRGDRRSPRLFHDQLRAPDALRRRARGRRPLAGQGARTTRQRFDDEPRGARRGA